jgi:hemerythrin
MQTFISWSENYNTGNFVIDHQNRRLIQLINELEEVSRHTELKPALMDVVLNEVIDYIESHFKTEEKIMDQISFSEINEHKTLHKELLAQINTFKKNAPLGLTYFDPSLFDALRNWLLTHIITEDPKIIKEMCAGTGMV